MDHLVVPVNLVAVVEAGAVIYKSSIPVSTSPGSYTIVIGAGGAGGTGVPSNGYGDDGANSTGFSLTADGGGAGGWRSDRPGQDGGSGGGGSGHHQDHCRWCNWCSCPCWVISNPTSADSPDAGWGRMVVRVRLVVLLHMLLVAVVVQQLLVHHLLLQPRWWRWYAV